MNKFNISNKELVAYIAAIVAVVTVALIIGNTALKMHKIDAEINAQTEVERTQIEEEQHTNRTKERLNWIPWYKDKSDGN